MSIDKKNQVRNTALVSVVVTVLVVAAFVATFIGGMNYEKGNNAQVQTKVEAAVKSVK